MSVRFLSSLCCPMRICIRCWKSYQECFHQNPLLYSSDTAVSSTQLIYSFMSLFICLFILLSLLIYIIFFQIDRLELSFTDSVFRFCFRFRDSVSVSVFRIPCFKAAVNLLRKKVHHCNRYCRLVCTSRKPLDRVRVSKRQVCMLRKYKDI